MTEIKTKKIDKSIYIMNCEKCGKEISGVSLKAVRHNLRLHKMFCKRQEAKK